jgi:hypothetical protein
MKKGVTHTIALLLNCFIVVFMTMLFFAKTAHASSGNIIINEIYPEPSDSSNNEFIELYNNGTETVDLSGWAIDDRADIDGEPKSSSPYVFKDLFITPGEYKVFYKKSSDPNQISTEINLNDSEADEARLLDSDSTVINSVKYDKAIKGQSYAFFGTDG